MSIFKWVRIATTLILAASISATAANATPASSTTSLNVRSGPDGSFGIVDTLHAGEVVDVGECRPNGWCYITHSGPAGWVSSNYLTTAPSGSGNADPDCSLSLTFNSNGKPSLAINCGDAPPAPAPAPAPAPVPVADRACFYNGQNFSGNSFCRGPGTKNVLNVTFNDRISSVELEGNARVKLCVNKGLLGFCRIIGASRANLGPAINNRASSLVVFTGPPPAAPGPITLSTGAINLPLTFSADLDNGNVTSVGADIWYQSVDALSKFIVPQNGARLAVGDGSARNYAGCSTAAFSRSKVSIWTIPVGTYICARTNRGRISQFRINGFNGTALKLGYTTWAN